MKTIMINGLSILGEKEPHGPQRFGRELILALDSIVLSGEYELIFPNMELSGLENTNLQNIKIVKIPYNCNKYKWRFRFDKFACPKYIKAHNGIGADLVLTYPWFQTDAVFIHDSIAKEHPEESITKKDHVNRIKFLFFEKHCLKHSKILFTVSNYSREKIMNVYKKHVREIHVVGNAWQHILRIREDCSIISKLSLTEKSYYFSAGVGQKRKNFKWIIEAAKQNPEDIFVIAGSNVAHLLKSETVIPKNILPTGFISDAEYKALLLHCTAYIQPSFEEGFGIPPLEALGVGTEIIISNIPVFKEIYENSAHYIEPLEYTNINMKEIMASPVTSAQTVLEKYSWEQSAKKFDDIMKTFFDGSPLAQ
ncbi:MAG: glycosyltransferase [Ruminococcus flavefaciens]|nr:glycosyltransferase [Ruminococcus flavefaciens]